MLTVEKAYLASLGQLTESRLEKTLGALAAMMRFRAVRIDVETDDGLVAQYRTDFGQGLVIVSGPNSVGKSLLFQSLIYGLGLDGMYGPRRSTGPDTSADGGDHARRSVVTASASHRWPSRSRTAMARF